MRWSQKAPQHFDADADLMHLLVHFLARHGQLVERLVELLEQIGNRDRLKLRRVAVLDLYVGDRVIQQIGEIRHGADRGFAIITVTREEFLLVLFTRRES